MSFETAFWFWKHKLDGILTLLSIVAEYDLSTEELEIIKSEIKTTDDEKNCWANYVLKGKLIQIKMQLAYDGEDTDIIHIRLTASEDINREITLINKLQATFKNLEI